MNILQVIHRFLPTDIGGSELYTYQLCKELSKRHNVHLMFTSRDLTKAQYSTKKGEYEGLPFTEVINNSFYGSFKETYRNSIVDKIFLDILKEMNPDIVHIQHLKFLSANIVKIARASGIPVVYTLHDFWLMCPRDVRMKPDMTACFEVKDEECISCISNLSTNSLHLDRLGLRILNSLTKYTTSKSIDILRNLKASIPDILMKTYQSITKPLWSNHKNKKITIQVRNAYLKEICSKVDMFIAPSHNLKDEFIKFGIPTDKIIYSCHGHLAGWVRNVTKKSTKLRFGFVGMIAKHKGIDILIEAFNRVKKKDVELNIFGGCNVNLRYCKRLERSIKNPAIRLRGEFKHNNISDVYSEIDVLVLPSICFENAPMTICEAFTARIPVITSNFGGMAELVQHGKNGLLFKVGDPDDLYEKIKMIIDNRQLIDQLAIGISSIKTIEEDAKDFEKRYLSLIGKTHHYDTPLAIGADLTEVRVSQKHDRT
ncbi:MAG: glycosyltransferase family 4 protein [Planctomycetota bacterium]|jgi:glycosyltransferase involved in cell wall biosynthesis